MNNPHTKLIKLILAMTEEQAVTVLRRLPELLQSIEAEAKLSRPVDSEQSE